MGSSIEFAVVRYKMILTAYVVDAVPDKIYQNYHATGNLYLEGSGPSVALRAGILWFLNIVRIATCYLFLF